jgi:hypothetical protein
LHGCLFPLVDHAGELFFPPFEILGGEFIGARLQIKHKPGQGQGQNSDHSGQLSHGFIPFLVAQEIIKIFVSAGDEEKN